MILGHSASRDILVIAHRFKNTILVPIYLIQNNYMIDMGKMNPYGGIKDVCYMITFSNYVYSVLKIIILYSAYRSL